MAKEYGYTGGEIAGFLEKGPTAKRSIFGREKGSSQKWKRWLKRFRKSRNNSIFKSDP